VVAYAPTLPTGAQTQALSRDLIDISRAHPDPQFGGGVITATAERGFHDPLLVRIWLAALVAAAIAVGAACISTALSNADRSEDFLTLEAVGASPANRRLVSAARAAVIAVTGTVLGAVAGFVPVLAFITASNRGVRGQSGSFFDPMFGGPGQLIFGLHSQRMHLVIPFAHLLPVLGGIPLLAVVLAGVLTRSRVSAAAPSY
jgi:putative ABC transport system permease protein